MAVTNYYSVGGEIIGEKTAGASRIDYLTDALGSVTATLNQSAQIVNTYRYKPYGGLLAKTGTGADPAFGWVGAHGCRQINKQFADEYMRARHYSSMLAVFLSEASLKYRMIGEHPYSYALNNPTNIVDPFGLYPPRIGPVPPGVSCHGADAYTGCNIVVGQPYTLPCNTNCDAPCTDAHEGQHRHDISKCCSRMPDCLKHHTKFYCLALYAAWFNANAKWSECRAYHSGADCRNEMKKKRDCDSCPPDDKCCHDLKAGLKRDQRGIDKTCQGINPWTPAPTACPF